MHKTVATQVFPFLQRYGEQVGGGDSTYSDHMKGARFTIPTPALLSEVVDMLDELPLDNRDTSGDLYEYLLSKIASAADATQCAHFHRSMFHGYDFDSTMLRIGSMNMLLHGIESPDIRYRDSLSEGASEDASARRRTQELDRHQHLVADARLRASGDLATRWSGG